MAYAIQWLRSVVFVIQMYIAMAVFGIVFAPFAIWRASMARRACKVYSRWVIWTASWMIGLKTEVRGEVPTGEVLVAAKHQSFLDIFLIYNALPYSRFVMKKELLAAPFIGQYARRFGCVAVDRGKGSEAIRKMLDEVNSVQEDPGQLVIYAQGTRVAPGQKMPYKVGAGALYVAMDRPCVPVATNVGVFWPKRSFYRKPGLAVVEFLPAIEAGKSLQDVMGRLEADIETASDRLMLEAGFEVKNSQD